MKHLLSALLALTLFISCSPSEDKNETTDYTAQNDKEITDYIAKNNLTAQKSTTGLYYVINDPGTGKQPTATSNITVTYKGYLTNGFIFDERTGDGIPSNLNEVIKGWTEGLQHLKEGGSATLLIPAHLAYGNYPNGPI